MDAQKKIMKSLSLIFSMLFSVIVVVGNYLLAKSETMSIEEASTESSFMKIDGLKIHYATKGIAGKPVILVHGFGNSIYSWRKNFDFLAQSFRVYALDLPGFGYSTRVKTNDYSTKKHAQIIKKFIESFSVNKASFVGNSLGAEVIVQFASEYPSSVEKLVLIDGPPSHVGSFPFHFFSSIPMLNKALLYFFMLNPFSATRIYRSAYSDSHMLTDKEIKQILRPLHVRGTSDSLISMALSKPSPLNLSRISEVQTLIIWGQEDAFIKVDQANRIKSALPNSRLVIMKNAGHLPHEEKPDQVNSLLLDFLSS